MVALRLVHKMLPCFYQRSASALSHDGLWVFADRILANRIFADRVLADWRCRHWGWLLARQIGGSRNAQHGHEPSRYDYDRLHDANPLVLAPGTGRPSDAPFRFVFARRPLYHPTFRLNRQEEWLPTICRLDRSKGSNASWDQDAGIWIGPGPNTRGLHSHRSVFEGQVSKTVASDSRTAARLAMIQNS